MIRPLKEPPRLGLNDTFTYDEKTRGMRVTIEWISSNGIICDLDLIALIYDERARFIEKLTFDNPVSQDGSCGLEADVDSHTTSTSHEENVVINLSLVSPTTAAILLLIDGGPRNFQSVQSVIVHCVLENPNNDSEFTVDIASNQKTMLFQTIGRTRKDFQGIASLVIYRDTEVREGCNGWVVKNLYEPLFVATSREKEERCLQLLVAAVPVLHKYRPRLFPSVKALCSALSSTSLPLLKKSFQKDNGLPIKQFVEVLFYQLSESHPHILDDAESGYAVALLQDMFTQIDFNGDGTVDWDEFTTFCIHTGLVGNSGTGGLDDVEVAVGSLDSYVIEYTEDKQLKENELLAHSDIITLSYIPEQKRIMVIQDKSDKVLMFDEDFKLVATLDSLKMLVSAGGEVDRDIPLVVYDVCYIPSKDLYSYTTSDHTIIITREHSSLGGKRVHYVPYNRIFHKSVHVKLVWAESLKILCSVAADNVIYGWELDGQTPIFHLIRHKDLITGFLVLNELDLFVTSSLDKRIVLWSMSNRRVKGVLLGHKRGVRCLSYGRSVLLSAGFECEAKTWDLSIKEPVMILRGHRRPLTCVKIMTSEAHENDDTLNAITVDDSGEFRLWNILVREKAGGLGLAPVLQIFNMSTCDPTVSNLFFFEMPYRRDCSKGSFSNLIVGGKKLHHFTPEKNAKEYIPPTATHYNDANSCLITAIGQTVLKYDITSGTYMSSITECITGEVTALCLDADVGRRIYVGCSNGLLLLMNFATGQMIGEIMVHTKEICGIVAYRYEESRHIVATGSLDGKIKVMEEISGNLNIHSTSDNVFGDGIAVSIMVSVPSLSTIIAGSSNNLWGAFTNMTLRRIFMIHETASVCAIQLIGASGDEVDFEERLHMRSPPPLEHLAIVAIALPTCIRIYCINVSAATAYVSHCLTHFGQLYISNLIMLNCPNNSSVNYSLASKDAGDLGSVMIATTDEGNVISWDANNLRHLCIEKYHDYFNTKKLEGQKLSRCLRKNVLSTIIRKSSLELGSSNDYNSNLESTFDLGTSKTSLKGKVESKLKAKFNMHKVVNQFDSAQIILGRSSTSTSTDNIPGENSIQDILSDVYWNAHSDIISGVVPLHEHGCLITVSLDGYQRLWNLEADCLGELPLPNLTERMKKGAMMKGAKHWKFILERIPVTEYHIRQARHLVDTIRIKHHAAGHDRRFAAINLHTLYGNEANTTPASVTVESEHSRRRTTILQSLKSSNVTLDNSVSLISSAASLQESNSMVASEGSDGGDDHTTSSHTYSRSGSRKERKKKKNAETWHIATSLSKGLPTAFSESSLILGSQEGLIDIESHRLLRKIGKRVDKVSAYGRLIPDIMLRDIHATATLKIPALSDIQPQEVSFGTQKEMYKNANEFCAENRRLTKIQARHIVSLSRIKSNVRNVGSMVKILDPATNHLVLPPVMGPDEEHSDDDDVKEGHPDTTPIHDQGHSSGKHHTTRAKRPPPLARILSVSELSPSYEKKSSTSKDAKSVTPFFLSDISPSEDKDNLSSVTSNGSTLKTDKIEALMSKVKDANETSIPDWEIRQIENLTRWRKRGGIKRVDSAVTSEVALLEKKLLNSLKLSFVGKGPNSEKKILTTRSLLPFYKMADVKHFVQIFQKVDEDYSGYLDVNEWVKFFSSLNKVSDRHAREIFMQVDKKNVGLIGIVDLIPVVFNQANKEQQKLITQFVEGEITKKKSNDAIDMMNQADLESLFEFYDVSVIGFVAVGYVRDKIKSFQLPDAAQFAVLLSMKDMADDEMVNLTEFSRFFSRYITL